ncbi:hypothetical protein [Roseivivax sp.]
MANSREDIRKEPVKGGVVARGSQSGRFVSVETEEGTSHASEKSLATLREVSTRRRAALKRLADR